MNWTPSRWECTRDDWVIKVSHFGKSRFYWRAEHCPSKVELSGKCDSKEDAFALMADLIERYKVGGIGEACKLEESS